MNLTTRLAALGLAVCAAAPAAESLTLDVADQPLELAVSELLERYARPNHLQLRVDPHVAGIPLKLLETCTLDRGALSALLRAHGVSLISAGPRLFAASAREPNHWPAIPTLLEPGAEAPFPTELVTTVVPVPGERLAQALLQVHGADQHQDVTLTWIGERLVLTGPAERVGYYLELAGALSQGGAPTIGLRTLSLSFARAEEVASHLRAMLDTAKGEAPAFRPRPTITADARTNTLFLRGPAAWQEQARRVVEQLDVRVAEPEPGPGAMAVDLALFVVDAARWEALSAGQAPQALAEALANAEGVERLWSVERWRVTERDTVLQDRAHALGQALGLANLDLKTRRLDDGQELALDLGVTLAEGGAPTRSVQAQAVLSLEQGPGILARSLGPDRVVVLVAR
ncbi:MAG: secretin N-terminal domain-containing protein [Planctomycetota bacterium]